MSRGRDRNSQSRARSTPEGRRSPPQLPRARRLLSLAVGLLIAGAFYLLLIDTTALPELYAGAGAVALGALGFQAGREQGFVEMSSRAAWLARGWRGFARVPGDLVRVSAAILAQAAHPRAERGVLRAVPFDFGEPESPRDAGRRALAEAFGSLAPNTIVIGVDRERDLILAHQLLPSGGAEAIDVLGLR